MLEEVTRLWEPHKDRYAAVVYLRPDMHYVDDLDVVQLLTSVDGELTVPFFLTEPGHPADMMAFGTPEAALVFGNRLKHAKAFAARRYLNSHVFRAGPRKGDAADLPSLSGSVITYVSRETLIHSLQEGP